MNANQKPVAQAMGIVKFNAAKVTHAVPMTAKQEALFETGVTLGAQDGESTMALADALKAARSPEDRKVLRAGFVHGLASDASEGTKAHKAAQNRFDYLARKHSPQTSRKSASTSEKRGRKEKAEAAVAKLSEKDVAQRLVAILAYVAECQRDVTDADTLGMLGKIAKIANGAK